MQWLDAVMLQMSPGYLNNIMSASILLIIEIITQIN